MDKPNFPEIEIFRAGEHTAVDGTKVNVSHADLAAIAASYDPAQGEAPLVVGHPQLNGPAYGWVEKLEARDGVMFATPHQVDTEFADMVQKGRFKKRSASFFQPDSPGNPTPGRMYLRHVGFLGAAAPAVTGLKDVQFAADARVLEFASARPWWVFSQVADLFRRLRDRMIESEGMEKADEVLPDWQLNSLREAADIGRDADNPVTAFAAPELSPPPAADPSIDFAARDQALSSREALIAARESALREQERQTRRVSVADFAAQLVQQGRLLPRHSAGIVELLVTLDAEPAVLSFASPDGSAVQRPRVDVLRDFLASLPIQVDMTERSAGADLASGVDFAAPPGAMADRARLELLGKARAYQAAHPNTSLHDAVIACGGE